MISLSSDPSEEIVLPRYLNVSRHFSSVPSMEMDGWGLVMCGAALSKASVFPKLMVRTKSQHAWAKQTTMSWRWFSLCATRAQTSARRVSRMSFSLVLDFADRRRRSNREPSVLYLM